MVSAQGVVLAAALTLLAGLALGFILGKGRELARQNEERKAARDEASRILELAREEGESTRKEAELKGREDAFRLREDWEREEARRREELERTERRLSARSDSLDRKFDDVKARDVALEARTEELRGREQGLEADRAELTEALEATKGRLESVSGLSAEAAKEQLIAEVRSEAEAEGAQQVRLAREEAQRTANREAKNIIGLAIQRIAADESAQATVSVVQLPSDDMKGRIIGREGRNIRSFEQATGIDVIIDDTPEAIVLSGFDPIRREIARIAMEKLVEDGRIHPGRIEEMVGKSQEEVEEGMLEAAEQALYDLGIHKLHAEIVGGARSAKVPDFVRPEPAPPFERGRSAGGVDGW